MNALKILKKLEDFRLLPFFVIISIIAGILIGKELGISEFQLTPPIDAISRYFLERSRSQFRMHCRWAFR